MASSDCHSYDTALLVLGFLVMGLLVLRCDVLETLLPKHLSRVWTAPGLSEAS
jgi:hypothetical protein